MSTCETCRHWLPPAERDGYGDVIRINLPDGSKWTDAVGQWTTNGEAARQAQHDADRLFGECGAIDITEVEFGEPIPLAVTMDASEYRANLYTQAGFGCAMWEPKP